MDFKLQAVGPFLHWLTLIILSIMPVVASLCDLPPRQSPRKTRAVA